MQIPVHFKPRWYQSEALRALENGIKFAVWCWSRRGGKDMTAFAYAIKKMVESPMNVALIFPTKEQGRKAFWENVENDGFKTIEHIPRQLIARYDNKNMSITLINGSTFSLLGTTDPEALRGANAKLYIFSEFVDIISAALDIVRPVVAVNGGQIIIQSTPKIDGISGGTFKILFDLAMKNPKQFASRITAEQYLDEETLEEIRQQTIAEKGNDFFYKQEFMCDWGQASATSYFGTVLKEMENDKQIDMWPHNPAYPVFTAWDLGMSDSTAITFFQFFLEAGKPLVRIIDYYETSNLGNKAIIAFLATKPYNFGWHFFPHDAAVRDSDAITRIEKIREMGLTNSSLLKREPKEDGINRAVTELGKAVIHRPTTIMLVQKLYLYKRKFNPHTGDYMGPEHKTESHAADSIKYLFCAIETEFNKETCEMYYSQASQEESYDTDELAPVTNLYSPSG